MQLPLPAPPKKLCGWPWESEQRNVHELREANLPSVTIVTPSFNQGNYLEATIRSILLQDYPNLQYIVVDGGSTDNSHEILDRYSEYISCVIRESDEGQSDAICKGIKLANGDVFNWINSDDYLRPGVLRELGQNMKQDVDLYTFPVSVEGNSHRPYLMKNYNLNAESILRDDRYSFSQPGIWYRTNLLLACGGIDRNLNYGFDWDLLIRYLAASPCVFYSDTVGAIFRIHDQSKTVVESAKDSNTDNRFKLESDLIRTKLEKMLPPHLAYASRLGRRRQPWHQYLVELLDDFDQSPFRSSTKIFRKMLEDPGARLSTRTFGAVLRLLSRYFRPKFTRTAA